MRKRLRCLKLKVLNSKTSYSLATQLCELEDRNGEQDEVILIQGEMLSDLLYHVDALRSMEPGGSWRNCPLSHFPSFINSPG